MVAHLKVPHNYEMEEILFYEETSKWSVFVFSLPDIHCNYTEKSKWSSNLFGHK